MAAVLHRTVTQQGVYSSWFLKFATENLKRGTIAPVSPILIIRRRKRTTHLSLLLGYTKVSTPKIFPSTDEIKTLLQTVYSSRQTLYDPFNPWYWYLLRDKRIFHREIYSSRKIFITCSSQNRLDVIIGLLCKYLRKIYINVCRQLLFIKLSGKFTSDDASL